MSASSNTTNPATQTNGAARADQRDRVLTITRLAAASSGRRDKAAAANHPERRDPPLVQLAANHRDPNQPLVLPRGIGFCVSPTCNMCLNLLDKTTL